MSASLPLGETARPRDGTGSTSSPLARAGIASRGIVAGRGGPGASRDRKASPESRRASGQQEELLEDEGPTGAESRQTGALSTPVAPPRHPSFHFSRNSGVQDGEAQVVADHTKRGALPVAGAAYYDPEDIEKEEYQKTSYCGVSYQVSSLSLISSVTESFRVVLDLNFFFRIEDNDKEIYEEYQKKGSISFQEIVDENIVKVKPPVFEIRNAVDTPEESAGRISNIQQNYDHRRSKWSWYVNMYIQIRCECYEEFEMERFPFTKNSMQIQLQSCQAMNTVMFVPYNSRSALPHHCYDAKAKEVKEVFKRGNSLKIDKTSGNWTIEQHHAFFVPDSMLAPMPSGNKFSTCIICIQCRQAASFYIWNTFIVVVWLPILSMFCVVEDATAIADRMSIVLTLLLTMSTYKIVIADWIPQKDYLTLMDKYILLGFMLILLIALWVMISAFLGQGYAENPTLKDFVEVFELGLMAVIAVFWICCHLYVYCTWSKWYLPWGDILKDENERLRDIAKGVNEERREMSEVKLLAGPKPNLPQEKGGVPEPP